jgi:SAM-dependent methyltransferase
VSAAGQLRTPRFLSIGSGDCSVEIGVAQSLVERGLEEFTIECMDLAPNLQERAEKSIRDAGLTRFFELVTCDFNYWKPEVSYDGIMANHVLHHIVELEGLFEKIHSCLSVNGLFVTNDMIGRNGHMRWPEVQVIIEKFWAVMPEKYKQNHQLRRLDESFVNWDCSAEGFEGVRAQDILPLLVDRFHFIRFLGFGGLVDLFVDRCYGFNLDPTAEQDRAFIDLMELLTCLLVSSGDIKPTMMFAVMSTRARDLVTDRGWTPEFCLRKPDEAPPKSELLRQFGMSTEW